MSYARRLVPAVLALSGPVLVGLTGCGGDDNESTGGTVSPTVSPTSACVLEPANAAANVPADVPVPAGAVFFKTNQVGKTRLYFAYIDGDDVRAARATMLSALTAAGYQIKGQDAEGNVEAEAEFDGKHEGRLQVIHVPDCAGKLRLRYILVD